MDKENQLMHELGTARRHEKALSTKMKRLERVCQQQEEDIIRMSVELENLKMELAAKDSGFVSPGAPRSRKGTYANGGGRLSPTSDLTDRYSDRLSAGYPERLWDRYSDRNSDRGSDSGSYVTTPHERKTFFSERFADDMSTSDESEFRSRVVALNASDTERMKRREKLLSRRLKNYKDVQDTDGQDNPGHSVSDNEESRRPSRDRVGDANETPNLDPVREHETSDYKERAVDVAPDLLNTTPERSNPSKFKGFSRPRWFSPKKAKGNKSKSKSMEDLNAIGRVDIKNMHKKNKKYNFLGCVRARESINENIRSEYAPVKKPQVMADKEANTANATNTSNANDAEKSQVDFI